MVRSFRQIVLEAGIVGGLLFAIHVSIPNCGNWPFIWPALAGASAVWLATRQPQLHPLRTGLWSALVTALVTGVIALAGVATIVYAVVHLGIVPAVRQSVASRPGMMASVTPGAVAIAASLAAIDVIVAFCGGALMIPARHFQIRHAKT